MRERFPSLALLAGAAMILAACTTDWHAETFGLRDTPNIVVGTVILDVPDAEIVSSEDDGSCQGVGGYAAFGPGMEVVLTDQHGAVVAESRTRYAGLQPFDPGQSSQGAQCVAGFVLKDVSYHSDTYTIAVGEPGTPVYATVSFTGEELEATRRFVTLTIEADA